MSNYGSLDTIFLYFSEVASEDPVYIVRKNGVMCIFLIVTICIFYIMHSSK